ncbi:hypothetical protein [Achromobacter spanius]|uniref:hypothetical protein n=1 Tax=Achromobacter spanius TaxID=217203 RepID=UPI0038090571
MLTPTSESVRWSSPAASDLLDRPLHDRRVVLAATRNLALRWIRATTPATGAIPHVLNLPDSTALHYRIDGAGILIESLESPDLPASNRRVAPEEPRGAAASGASQSDYVLLSRDEYLALLHRMPGSGGARPAPTAPGPAASLPIQGSTESPLLTEAARRDAAHSYMAQVARAVPDDGTIPQDVLERAAQNHWQLPRAWREYLGLTKQQAAARASISAVRYGELEEGFAQICSQRKQVIAFGLSLQAEQLLL